MRIQAGTDVAAIGKHADFFALTIGFGLACPGREALETESGIGAIGTISTIGINNARNAARIDRTDDWRLTKAIASADCKKPKEKR